MAAGAAGTGLLVAGRKARLGEDVDWEAVRKPGRIVEVDGYGAHCVLQGDGPTLILIHGFGGNTFSYRRVISPLARDHRVIAVDLKGCGYSERDANAGLSLAHQVAMLRKLFDLLGVEHASLVGHSLGGVVAQDFAAQHPPMVDSLVLVASPTGDERWAEYLAGFVRPAFLRPLVPPLVGLTNASSWTLERSVWLQVLVARLSYMRLLSERLLRLWAFSPSSLTDEVREGYGRPMRIRGTLACTLRSVREAKRAAAIDRSRITMPVLLLYAAEDRAVPLSAAYKLQKSLRGSSLTVIDGAGHLLLEERPEECVRAVEDFLRHVGVETPRSPRRDGR